MEAVIAQFIVSAIVGFLGAGLGVMVTVQVMKHRIEWLHNVLEKMGGEQKEAILRIHGRIDGLDARLAEHLAHHAHGKFRA